MSAYPLEISWQTWLSIPATLTYLVGLGVAGRFIRRRWLPGTSAYAALIDVLLALGLLASLLVLVGRYTPYLIVTGRFFGGGVLILGLHAIFRGRPWKRWRLPKDSASRALIALLVMLFAALAIAAQCPPTKADELSYHLPFLDRALRDGAFRAYPSPLSAIQPLALQVATLPLLALGLQAAATMMSLAGILVFGYGLMNEWRARQGVDNDVGLPMIALLLTTPWAVVWGIAPGNDIWSALSLALATLLAIEAWYTVRYFPLFCVASSVSVLIKSSAIVPITVLGTVLVFRLLHAQQWKNLFKGAAAAFLLILPFALRSYSDWGVWSPDPLYFAGHLQNIDVAGVLHWIEIKRVSDTFWPRSMLGMFYAPLWTLSHKEGLLGVAFGPGFLIALWYGARRLRAPVWALLGLSAVAGLWAVTFLLPQMPRYYGGTWIAMAFAAGVAGMHRIGHANRWRWIAVGYVALNMVLLAPYIHGFLHYAFSNQDLLTYLRPRIEMAEARLFLANSPVLEGKIFTNGRQLLYAGSTMELLEGGNVSGRHETTFSSGTQIRDYLRAKGFTHVLWSGDLPRKWAEMAELCELIFDDPNAVLQGTRQYGPIAVGRVRIFALGR